ncbi:MAG TPA: hypothetical protein VFE47_20960 [Tepidisphaeraceae bacterium]|jgi:hypothetical protein|nr:hypothetical protein [Tepidisphaeraceae bacterium]
MNRVLESSKMSPQTVTAIGIAVHRAGLHIGLLYRVTANDSVRILHLRYHQSLASEQPGSAYICWIRREIEPDRAVAIATYCRRIWKQNRRGKVPFGFSLPTEFFSPSGSMLTGPAKTGLTCASFVLSVFSAASVPLVNTDSWPPPTAEDIKRQAALLNSQRHLMRPDEIRAVSEEIGNPRFRPVDVAGAATAEKFPATYAYASKVGKRIAKLLATLNTDDGFHS